MQHLAGRMVMGPVYIINGIATMFGIPNHVRRHIALQQQVSFTIIGALGLLCTVMLLGTEESRIVVGLCKDANRYVLAYLGKVVNH